MAKKATKKPAAKKTAAKKTVAKRAAPMRAAKTAPAKAPKITKVSEKLSKSSLLGMISDHTGLSKKDVNNVFAAQECIIEASVKKGALGEFTLPGLIKIVTIRKPASKAREGINPFTGEKTMFKAKPARTVVKVRALKKLKDMVA